MLHETFTAPGQEIRRQPHGRRGQLLHGRTPEISSLPGLPCRDAEHSWSQALSSTVTNCGARRAARGSAGTEAVTRDSWNRTAYHQMLRHLSPRAHGTLMEMLDFAARCASRTPHGPPVVLLSLAARMTKDSVYAFAADGHWYESQAAATFGHCADQVVPAEAAEFSTGGTAPGSDVAVNRILTSVARVDVWLEVLCGIRYLPLHL